MVEIIVRLAAIAALTLWCFDIIRPFVGPVLWGVIIAVASSSLFTRLEGWLGGRSRVAASIFVVFALLLFIIPALKFSETLVTGAQVVAERLDAGTLEVPAPPDKVADWPIIGNTIYPFWHLASQNLESALVQVEPQLKLLSGWLLSAAGSAALGVALFFMSLVVSGAILANREAAEAFGRALARRLAGSRGDELLELARSTTIGVATGIIGVALIQAVLAGIGFVAAGVPAAGLWAMLVLVVAVVQLPVGVVLTPIVIYVFSVASTTVFVIFLIWSLVVGLIDNVLKPLFFGRDVEVPTLVIFIGAIGGMMNSGIIGLFTGSVVLAVGYKMFESWLHSDEELDADSAQDPAQG